MAKESGWAKFSEWFTILLVLFWSVAVLFGFDLLAKIMSVHVWMKWILGILGLIIAVSAIYNKLT